MTAPAPLATMAGNLLDGLGNALAGVPGAVWDAARGPLEAVALLALALVAARAAARRRRRWVRLWLVPYRSDVADPDSVRRLFEACHQQLVERWWRRLALGQRGFALEVVMAPDTEGDRAARLSLVCPEELVDDVEGSLRACYPDSRLVRGGQALPPVRTMVRLKKRKTFVRALRTSLDEDGRVMDLLLNQMAAVETTSVVQLALTPAPGFFDNYSRWRYRRLEHGAESAHARNLGNPGLRSEVLIQELEGGLGIQHRALFFTDVRIGSSSYSACRAIAGALRGGWAGENRLAERRVLAPGRLAILGHRLTRGLGNPVPNWRRGVLSSAELAGAWSLPSPGLRTVRVARSPIPRLPAPPEVSRAPEHTLAADERGSVGIRPQDKSDGLGLIGGQKTGKTSVLCRTVQADAADPDCALVVLMPKPGDATKALSMVPPGRTVHYLDLEHPELGINPLLGDGDASMIADKVVEAFRDVHAEGDIKGSSDRYLRQAAQAAIGASRAGVVDGPPTLWHMYRMLLPPETAFRERVVEALYSDPRFTDTATFFGRELPSDLANAAAQTNAKLDAPRNKLLRLMVDSLDKVLRHPTQISMDELIRNKEVLIVDGKMGTFGTDNCRVMMQFILTSLYGALQRQQQRPDAERVRVALKVDEAHLIINESFADALATLRSAGLEVVAAWQYGEQIQDPKVRGGMMSLLRQRCMFSMGEEADAREMSTLGMAMYTDMIRTDPESRAALRITPDVIFNLPNHHAVCSWISRGVRQPAFLAQTLPLETDEAVVAAHLEAQRARGGQVPDRLPDPMPDLEWEGVEERPVASVAVLDVAPPAARERTAPVRAAATPVVEAAGVAAPAEPAGAPESYAELDLDDVRGIIWDDVEPDPGETGREPTDRELEILGALWSHRFLFATQIRRRWWPDASQRAAQQGLQRLALAGWVRRFKFQLGERGAQQRVYCLTKAGFERLEGRSGRQGPFVADDAVWRTPEISDPRRVLRDLHVNGWVLALEGAAGRSMGRWLGAREGRLEPPRRKSGGEWVDQRPSELVLGSNHRLQGFDGDHFPAVHPDATVELRVGRGEKSFRTDLLIEMDRGRGMGTNEERLRGYDGFVAGWCRGLRRYRTLRTLPSVVFVSEDARARLRLLKRADEILTTRIAKAGTDELEWPFPGRRGIFFAIERDLHEGSFDALALPELPPDLRERRDGPDARTCVPRAVRFVDPRLLRGSGH